MADPAHPAPQPDGWRRLGAISALGFASGAPNTGLGEILPIWLATSQVPVELIGLLPLAGLPYAIKFLWAPLLDRFPIAWPDRRRGWIALLQLLLGLAIAALALLRPSTDAGSLAAIGLVALVVAVLSATQDIVIDAYRTDLLPEQERGAGAAANSLGFRGGTLVLGSGALLIAGSAGYRLAFVAAGILMLLLVPCTLAAPRLRPLDQPVLSLRQAVVGPVREFLARTGGRRALQLLALVLVLIVSWAFAKANPSFADRIFRKMQFVSASAYSLGHGGNDAQKTMGIIAVLLFSRGMLGDEFHVPFWVVITCQAMIALGTLFGGWRIVHTMGSRITRLSPQQGFCAETGGAITLFMATGMGIPVSTTHTITGAIVGVGASRRLSAVRWNVASNIVVAWFVTLPAAAAISALTWWLTHLIAG